MKTQTAFRLEESLLEALKEQAKQGHRSLNNYVEFILSKVAKIPNETTVSAIEEARLNNKLEEISDIDSFLDSI